MDLSSITLVAQAVVALLTPYLKVLGTEAVKEIGKTAGKTSFDKAQSLYEKLKEKFSSKPSASESLDDLAKQPDDSDFAAAVRAQIKKIMQSDETFAKELADMVKETLEADRYFSPEFHTKLYGSNQSNIQTGNAPISAGNDFVGHDKVEIHTLHLSWNSDRLVEADKDWLESGINWIRNRYSGYELNFPSIELIAKNLDNKTLYDEGRQLTETRRYVEAVAYWAELHSRESKNLEYESYLRLCLSKVEREMRIDGAVRSLLGKAMSALRCSDYSQAIEIVNQALMLSPHDKEAFDFLVEAIQVQNDILKKLEALRRKTG